MIISYFRTVITGLAMLACLWTSSLFGQGNVEYEGESDTQILFVFDASNSMNGYWDGSRKIQTATRLLSATLDELYGVPGLQLGLRVYGHQTKFIVGKQDCDDTELLVPFSTGNNLVVKRALSRLQARGTTPIARSLERAAEDFPTGDARKVVILITDGIEACDEDPCSVSRMLQEKGIIVKPFIIGIGLEEQYKETFRCVGHFFDATDTDSFKEVLNIVIEQAMHDTTYEVDLLDANGNANESNVAVSLYDRRTGAVVQRYIHTLNLLELPDTMHVDPIPTYRVVVHTLPPLVLDSVRFDARSHNTLVFADAAQGILHPEFARGDRNEYGNLPVEVWNGNSCELIHTLPINSRVKFRTGIYSVRFPTFPPVWLKDIQIKAGQIAPVIIPQPGYLQLEAGTSGYGAILSMKGESVYKFDYGNPSGRYILQPGTYTLVFRARSAHSSEYSIHRSFTISSGNTQYLSIYG